MRSTLYPRVDPKKVRSHRIDDYVLRFGFGAGIALVAGLIGMAFGPKIGGLLLGFPAILPASLTLIQKKEGKDEASIDSVGAVLGAMAMVVFALLVALTVTNLGAAFSVVLALVVWLVVAVGLYFAVAFIFEREPYPG
jgi:hypothetical protein